MPRRFHRPPGRRRSTRVGRYLLAGLAVVVTTYLVVAGLTGDPGAGRDSDRKVSQPIPLHMKIGTRPPDLIRAPMEPIFPDPLDDAAQGEILPYEEALPPDIYEGDAVDLPPEPPEPYFPVSPRRAAPPAETGESSAVALLAEAPRGGKRRDEMPPPKPAPVDPVFQEPFPLPPPGVAARADRDLASLTPPGESPAAPPASRPRIAVVIDDMGIDRRRTRRAIALPGPLTTAFLTYADDLPEQTAAARAAGHELLVHVPMQPRNRRLDPGPKVLESDLEASEIRARLAWGLGRFEGFAGINNHMGSRFTTDPEGMAVVMDELKARGLYFLDSRTSGGTVGPQAARRAGVPYVSRNVFLDNINDPKAVARQLAAVERLARRGGRVVAIGHPRDVTLDLLADWLPTLDAKGFDLVPVSRMIKN